MPCSCIKGNGSYNFKVLPLDVKAFLYQDLSAWDTSDSKEVPDKYEVVVTPPGSSTKIAFSMYTDRLNVISASDIGYGDKLKDGLYCFETVSCGKSYKKFVAVLPHIECCIQSAYSTLNEQYFYSLREIEQHLKAAKIHAQLQKIDSANKAIKVVKKLLENLKCDCDCVEYLPRYTH